MRSIPGEEQSMLDDVTRPHIEIVKGASGPKVVVPALIRVHADRTPNDIMDWVEYV